MSSITLYEAQQNLPELIYGLAKGQELLITEDGQILARIVGERCSAAQRPGPGLCKGMITIVADDDEHLKDFAEYMP